MTADVQIDYEKLVADYIQSLTTVLRGFHSGLKHDFLETWVHDEDETSSILDIIEAARDSGLETISIRLSASTLKKIDLARLKDLAGREGSVNAEAKGDGLVFGVTFGDANARASDATKTTVAHFGERVVKPKAEVAVWKALTQEERQRRIQAALAEHPAGDGVAVVAMETPKRVVVGFREGLDNAAKQSRLMRLEDHLQQTLEPTLQLYVEPKVDQNKQRRIREARAL